MKNLFFLALLLLFIKTEAQITLEQVYDSASTFASGSPAVSNQLMIINFEVSGECYVRINRLGKTICIYNMSHILIKTISLASFPMNSDGSGMGDVLYLSEHLFNIDNSMEFMYITDGYISSKCRTGIYKDNGSLIFSDSAGPAIRINVPLQQYPIYNTTQGTKMILSYPNGQAKVFSLPGTLSEDIAKENNILLNGSGMLSNAYPNPTVNSTKIDYTLPSGVNEGVIVFYNLQGIEEKRFRVDRTFNTLLISISDIAAGTYLYQLQTNGQNSEGKKMIVIK